MPVGPGKYDDACTTARLDTEAETLILIVIQGKHGAGFSVQSTDPNIAAKLPAILQDVAEQLLEAERNTGM